MDITDFWWFYSPAFARGNESWLQWPALLTQKVVKIVYISIIQLLLFRNSFKRLDIQQVAKRGMFPDISILNVFHSRMEFFLGTMMAVLKCILLPMFRIITREFMDYKWINSWQNKARFYRVSSGSISNLRALVHNYWWDIMDAAKLSRVSPMQRFEAFVVTYNGPPLCYAFSDL